MKKKKKKKKEEKKISKQKKSFIDYLPLPSFGLSSDARIGILIVVIVMFGALSLVGLLGLGGNIGNSMANTFALWFGFGKWILPFILFFFGIVIYKRESKFFKFIHYIGLLLFIISIQVLFHIFYDPLDWNFIARSGEGGGLFGCFLTRIFYNNFGFWGSIVVLFSLLVISALFLFNTTLEKIVGEKSIVGKILFPVRFILRFISRFFRSKNIESDYNRENSNEEVVSSEHKDDIKKIDKNLLFKKKDIPTLKTNNNNNVDSKKIAEKDGIHISSNVNNIKIDIPLKLLEKSQGNPNSGNIKRNSAIIYNTLYNFNIPVEMGEVSVGPSVTQYTLKPLEGVKISKITNLSNDLALSLAAHPIRIEAPIPGKALVGIEVPNISTSIVRLRELFNSKEFRSSKSNMTVVLGEDVAGNILTFGVDKMPHILIAGATNSGKSVCIHSIIISLLYQNNPDELRFIFVDPKRLELPVYNGIAHLLTPVITDVNKTINALKWCLGEMDRRFTILSKAGKRNIQTYNENAEKGNYEKMPYIVFIIDELADLMIVAAHEIEAYIIRLTQMARAVGIHLILATQRPSVDVITGLIKANVPARIALSVASGVDSRTILDNLGAEKLIGKGDMLFLSPDLSKPRRLQGVFVSDLEVKKVVNYIIEKTGGDRYNDDVVADNNQEMVGGSVMSGVNNIGGNNNQDSLFEVAKEEVINSGKASATYLQRKFKIGFSRAASIIDALEESGVVGPLNGSKAREVLISKEEYARLQEISVSDVEVHNQEEQPSPDNYLSDSVEENIDENLQNNIEDEKNIDNESKFIEKIKNDDASDDLDDGVYFPK